MVGSVEQAFRSSVWWRLRLSVAELRGKILEAFLLSATLILPWIARLLMSMFLAAACARPDPFSNGRSDVAARRKEERCRKVGAGRRTLEESAIQSGKEGVLRIANCLAMRLWRQVAAEENCSSRSSRSCTKYSQQEKAWWWSVGSTCHICTLTAPPSAKESSHTASRK